MRALTVISISFLGGCASADMIPFSVDSSPQGAQVDVNGVAMGTTPTEIQLQCSKRWVGVAVAPGGWAYDGSIYEVTVYPPEDQATYSQTKRVNACQVREMGQGGMFFDLDLQPVSPRQTVDINVEDLRDTDASRDLEDDLRKLEDLYRRGILTESEYKEKRADLIQKFQFD